MSYSPRLVSVPSDTPKPRQHGERSEVGGLGPSDHICWAYDDPARMVEQASIFLFDGLAAGERVAFVGDQGASGAVAKRLSELGGDADKLEVWLLGDTYQGSDSIDPAFQVARYAALVDEALTAGFTGLRIVAEATPLVTDPARRSRFVDYEMAIEEFMATHKFSAMCAYRSDLLGSSAVTELASVHPLASQGSTTLQLFRHSDGVLGLAGEIDLANDEIFEGVLDRLKPSPNRPLVIDVSDLLFIDADGMLRLEGWAARNGRVVLRSPRSVLCRLAGLLDIDHIALEASA